MLNALNVAVVKLKRESQVSALLVVLILAKEAQALGEAFKLNP